MRRRLNTRRAETIGEISGKRTQMGNETAGVVDLFVRWVMGDQGKGISGPSAETSAHEARKLTRLARTIRKSRKGEGRDARECDVRWI